MIRVLLSFVGGILLIGPVQADEPGNQPRPVPPTRPEMKQLLEDMKSRKPRIPLPELTDADKEKLGERGTGYESRLRYHYMPAGEGRGGFGFSRQADPKTSLSYEFKTQLFWIVSRANNCQYCMGHQEWKLAVAGMKEEEIAALDCDWPFFKPAQQAAYNLARKLTLEPDRIAEVDFDQLRKHYTDLQILEMIISVAGNNSINRWKEGIGVPQSKEGGNFARKSKDAGKDPAPKEPPAVLKTFLTPTPEKYKNTISRVAALQIDGKTGKPSRLAVCVRPPLESREAVEKALEACRHRKPRLPLVDEATARAILPEDWQKGTLPQWVRLLANFAVDGKSRVQAIRSSETKGDLSPRLKAQISWIIARQDRAWYAVGQARQRLQELGLSNEQIYQLDGSWKDYPAAERALFKVARNLAASPVVLTDDDVTVAVKTAGPRTVVQVISYTTSRASFNRITEAAQLQLEK